MYARNHQGPAANAQPSIMQMITLAILLTAMQANQPDDSRQTADFAITPSPDSIPIDAPRDPWTELSLMLDSALNENQADDRRLRRKLAACERCHSTDLSASNSYLPVLQGQNRRYLARKILNFKNDRSAYHPMQAISQSLTLEDIVFISGFYANQNSPLDQGLVDVQQAGTEATSSIDLQSCTQCHGRNGDGAALIPDISGQNENYLAYRIREIARGESRVHRDDENSVTRCQIKLAHSSDSKLMARILTLALDSSAIIRGEEIYRLNCAACHDTGIEAAPSPDDQGEWQRRLANGFRQLERNALLGKQKMPRRGGNHYLSRNQIRDAIHYMLSRTRLFDTSAPF